METIQNIKGLLGQYEKTISDKITIQDMRINKDVKKAVYEDLQKQCNNIKSKLIEMIIFLPDVITADNPIDKEKVNIDKIIEETRCKCNSEAGNDQLIWKKNVSDKVNAIYDRQTEYSASKNIVKSFYEYMTNVYGIVWEQDFKEWKRIHTGVPRTLEIIYYNPQYKSIFDAILKDKYNETMKKHPNKLTVKEIIAPLVAKNQDKSNGGCATLKKIYLHMEECYNINWDKWMKRYIKENGTHISSKSDLLYWNHGLIEYFRISVEDLLNK